MFVPFCRYRQSAVRHGPSGYIFRGYIGFFYKNGYETIHYPKAATEPNLTGEYVMARMLLEVTDLWKRLAIILGMLRSIPENMKKQALDTLIGKATTPSHSLV